MANPNEIEKDNYPKEGLCYICGAVYTHYGNNPEPLLTFEKRVCDKCNRERVIPARLRG